MTLQPGDHVTRTLGPVSIGASPTGTVQCVSAHFVTAAFPQPPLPPLIITAPATDFVPVHTSPDYRAALAEILREVDRRPADGSSDESQRLTKIGELAAAALHQRLPSA